MQPELNNALGTSFHRLSME